MPESATRAGNETQSVLHVRGFADVLPLALEPRYMFDAAGAATAADSAEQAQADAEAENAAAESAGDTSSADGGDQESAALAAALAQASSTGFHEIQSADPAQNNGRKEAVLIDTSVADWQILANGVAPGKAIILLDGARDGISLMAQWAEGNSGYDAIHLLSHGSEGQLHVGTATLTQDKLAGRADELQMLGNALSEDGDLLLYGCDVASGEGAAFVNALATLTGADVAASTDMTGAASLGGDWDLERQTGLIETTALEGTGYQYLLSAITLGSTELNNFDGEFTVSDGFLTFTSGSEGYFYESVSVAGYLVAPDVTKATKVTIAVSPGESGTFGFSGFDYSIETSGEDKTANVDISIKITFSNDTSVEGTYSPGTVTNFAVGQITDLSVFSGLNASYSDVKEVIISSTVTGGTTDDIAALGVNNFLITLPGANAAPELGGTVDDVTITEDTATAINLSAYNVSDGDGDTITLTLAVDAGTIAATDGNGTTAGVTIANSGSGSMTLQGSAANLNTYLNDNTKIVYTPASNATASATLTVTPNDGTTDGTADTVTINITPVNDAPTASGVPTDVTVTEDTASDFDLSAVTITDVDGDNLTVTIAVSAGTFSTPVDGSGVGSGVTATLVNATTITLAGSAADINTYLDTASNIQYTGALNASGDNAATYTIHANDGTVNPQVGSGNIDITAVNDAPVFAGLDGTPSFTEGGSAVVLDGDVTISDVELGSLGGGNGNFAGASLVLVRHGGANASDEFSMENSGTLALVGSDIQSDGNVIGSFDTSVAGQLTISFHTNPSTTALVNEVMQAIRYSNSSNDPASSVQIDWTFSDGNAGNAQGTGDNPATATGSTTVSITNVNDAPTLSATGWNPTYVEGTGGSDLFNTVTASTVEAADRFSAMTMTVTNVSDGASEIIRFDGSDIALTNGNAVTTATNGLNVSVSVSGSTATISFAGATLTNAQMQTLVDGLTYRNSSDNPTTAGNRVVTITGITDNGGTANGGSDSATPNLSSTVTLTAVNDAPVATASGGTTAFTENGGAVVIDGSFTLSDVDSTNMTGATVEITDGFQSGEDTLSFADQNGITGSYNNGVLTLSGTATAAQYQTAIRSITFSNGSNDPSTANRTISITVNDGTDDSNTVTKTVSVAAVNDAPTLSATGGTPTFTENGTAVELFSGVTISTVESGQTITGMTFSVTHAEATDIITFDGTDIALTNGTSGTTGGNSLGYSVSVTGGVATITITGGTMTTAQAQTVVDGMTYASSSDNPGTSNRVVTLTGITDSGGTANGGTDSASLNVAATVSVEAVNDAPELANGGNSVDFSAGSGTGIVINNGLTVSDVDDTTLASATVSITGGLATGDTLGFTSDAAFGNITGSYNAGTGVLSLTSAGGTATVAQWQAALRSVTFSNGEASPATGTRTVSFAVNDGDTDSTAATSSVEIVFAPVIGNLNGDSVTYTEGDTAVLIDAGTAATITDSDNTHFNGGNLTVRITGGAVAGQDILGLSTGGTITLSGSTAGSTVSVEGTAIGTLANNIAAGNDLVINFDSDDATPTAVASLLAAIQYSNSSTDDPTPGDRTVRVTVTDASGGFTSAPAEVTVTVVGVNDAPTVSATGGTPTFTENGTAVDLFSGVTISTVESGQTITGMTFTVTNAEASDSITFDGTAISLVNGTGSTATNGLSYNVSVTGGVATITITGGTMDTTTAQNVIDGMTYSSSSDNPGTSDRVVTLTGITDSGGTANGGTNSATANIAATVTVSAVNDAPVNTVPGTQSAVSGEAKAITGISVSDVDSATVTTTVSVPNGDGTFSATGNATITGGGTHSIQISGSVADVNATLANLRYTAATTGSQTITVETSDGTDTDTDTVTVNVTARPAIGGLSGDSVAYTSGQTVKLDAGQNATVSDADFQAGAFSNGGNLTVNITGGGTASQDILKIDTAGTTVTLDGTTAGSNVRVDGTVIGTLANTIAAGNTLRINFNNSANLTNVQELVRALAYENSSGTPAGGNRTISVTLTDSSQNTSTTSTVTVRVTAPVADTPTPTPPPPAPTPVVTVPPILQTPGSTGGDAGTPVSNALSGGSTASGSGGQFVSGGPIQTTVTGQLGNTSPIGNSGTPVSTGLSVNQAGSGLGVTTGLGGSGGGAALTTGGFGGSGLGGGLGSGGLGGSTGGGFGGGSGGIGGAPGGVPGGAGGIGGGDAAGAGTGTPGANDGILGTPSTGGDTPGPLGGEGEAPAGEGSGASEGAGAGDGGQAMIDGDGEAVLASAVDDFSLQLAAFGDAVEKETMLLDQVLGTYRIPA